jgi:hypothetical protein
MVTVGGVPGDLAGPQSDSHYGVCIADHQQGEEVNQHRHTDVVPGGRWMRGVKTWQPPFSAFAIIRQDDKGTLQMPPVWSEWVIN